MPWGLSSKTTHVTHRPGSCGGGQRTGCCNHLHGSEGGNKGQRQSGGRRLHLGGKLSEEREDSKVKVDDCLVMIGFDFPRIFSQPLILCSCFFFSCSGKQWQPNCTKISNSSFRQLRGGNSPEVQPCTCDLFRRTIFQSFTVETSKFSGKPSLVQISKPLPAVPEQTKK